MYSDELKEWETFRRSSGVGQDSGKYRTDNRPASLKINPTSRPIQDTQISPVMIQKMGKLELERLISKPAFSSEEKYRVLDANDRLIRLRMQRTTDINRAERSKGTCPDMCPEKERLMREAKHQIAVYEMDEKSRYTINHKVAIKQYSRSSADQETPLSHELRPEPVLRMTMMYLLHEIADLCDQPDVNVSDWFHFVWDRTRSIRKDITQQELCSQGSVALVEQCARFHIHCSGRLVAEEPQVFDQKINTENLTKCLQSLKYMYHDLRLKNEKCPNEPEFRAYIILLNLNDCNFLWEVQQLPVEIQKSPEIKFAISVFLAIENNNYVQFFKLVRRTTYLNACILLRYFTQVRAGALATIVKAYCIKSAIPLPISTICYQLAFEDLESSAQFLEYYGLQCNRIADRVFVDKGTFYYPDIPFIMERAINVVEQKRFCSVGEVIAGGELPPKSIYENHVPQNSFDSRGVFKKDSDQDTVNVSDEDDNVEEEHYEEQEDSVDRIEEEEMEDEEDEDQDYDGSSNEEEDEEDEEESPVKELFKKPLPILKSPSTNFFSPSSFDQPDKSTSNTGGNVFGTNFKFELNTGAKSSNIFGGNLAPGNSLPVIEKSPKKVTFSLPEPELNSSKGEESDHQSQELEKEEEIASHSEKILEEVIKETILEEISEIAERAIDSHKSFEKSCEKQTDELIAETTSEMVVELVREENMNHHVGVYAEQKLLMRFFKSWCRQTKRVKLSKEKVQSAPIWMPNTKIVDQANYLKMPTQEDNISDRERYLSGRPVSLDLGALSDQKLQVIKNVSQILLNLVKSLQIQQFYWKAFISIPDQNEEKVGFNELITGWLQNSLGPSERKDCLFFKSAQMDHLHSICISLRLLTGVKMIQEQKEPLIRNNENVEGIIFFMSEEFPLADSKVRLSTLLKTITKNGLSLVVINCSTLLEKEIIESSLNLESYAISGKIRDFQVFSPVERSSLKVVVEKSLSIIGSSFQLPFKELKLKPITELLRETIGSPFWKRLQMNSSVNPIVNEVSHSYSMVINIYNEALNKLEGICCEDDEKIGTEFPEEFQDSLPKSPLILNFPHFPKNWDSEQNSYNIKQLINSLKLKPFPDCDSEDKKLVLSNLKFYLIDLMGDSHGENIFWLVLKEVQQNPTEWRIDWMKVTGIITNSLLENKLSEADYPANVVYNSSKLENFLSFPWWLQSSVMKRKFRIDPDDQSISSKRPRQSVISEDLTGVLDRAMKALERADGITQNVTHNRRSVLEVSQQYDERLSLLSNSDYQFK